VDRSGELQTQSSQISHEFMRMHALAVHAGLYALANGEAGDSGVCGYPHFLRARREFETLARGQSAWVAKAVPRAGVNGVVAGFFDPVHMYEPTHPLADEDGYVAYPARVSASPRAGKYCAEEIGRYVMAAEASRARVKRVLDMLG
jgi:flagellar basal body rod protein FlgC